MRDNGGCTIPNLDFKTVKNIGIQWDFDAYGNPIIDPNEDELFDTYKVPNKIYFTITAIETNQDDLINMDVYIFDVYVEGKFASHGSITSKIGYRSPNDCYDAAIIFIETYWNTIHEYYNLNINESNPKPEFHNTEDSFKIGKYYYTKDETNIWNDIGIFIKHLH
jgi:hypothetical protein